MSKPKISDIAKEAGVSSATVSYVLNNNPHQKINENTRKKIFQIASLLGYTKNIYASALASGKTNLIGLYTKSSSFLLKNAEDYSLIYAVTKYLKSEGYKLVLLSGDYKENINFVDAILTWDITEENFKAICNYSYIPVIAMDTKPHETWIFSVINTMKESIGENSVIVTYDRNSSYTKEEILKNQPNTLFIRSFEDLKNLKKETRKIITPDKTIQTYLNEIGVESSLLDNKLQLRLDKVLDCLHRVEARENSPVHYFEI